jgi:hypothetical protein
MVSSNGREIFLLTLRRRGGIVCRPEYIGDESKRMQVEDHLRSLYTIECYDEPLSHYLRWCGVEW